MSTNPMLENFLADAEYMDIVDVSREYAQEIYGYFDNDPVEDFGQESVDQVHRLCIFIMNSK